jgi:hypothetical protein
MTEQEWLACTDPGPILEFIRGNASDLFNRLFDKSQSIETTQKLLEGASKRKLRLFASACVRRVWKALEDRSRKVVEVSEQYADRRVDRTALEIALEDVRKYREAIPSFEEPGYLHFLGEVDNVGYWRCRRPLQEAAAELVLGLGADLEVEAVAKKAAEVAGGMARADAWETDLIPGEEDGIHFAARDSQGEAAYRLRRVEEMCAQAALLHDLFGNPFRPVTVDPSWQTPGVLKLAKMIYRRRRFDRMPELDAALEDAGCLDSDVRRHCGQEQEHVRGCWVVDLILGLG